ncbi:hypothetical protein ACFWYA_29405, partial [Streptomyces sp. NPDC059011]
QRGRREFRGRKAVARVADDLAEAVGRGRPVRARSMVAMLGSFFKECEHPDAVNININTNVADDVYRITEQVNQTTKVMPMPSYHIGDQWRRVKKDGLVEIPVKRAKTRAAASASTSVGRARGPRSVRNGLIRPIRSAFDPADNRAPTSVPLTTRAADRRTSSSRVARCLLPTASRRTRER